MKQFIFTCCFLLVRSIIYCQPGSIDPSFGDKGYVRTSAEETKFFSTGRALLYKPMVKYLLAVSFTLLLLSAICRMDQETVLLVRTGLHLLQGSAALWWTLPCRKTAK